MDCYIVRIYRRNGKSPRLFVGTVEEVGAIGKKGFGNFDELKEILTRPGREETLRARRKKRSPVGG